MAAIDATFERIHDDLDGLREEMRGLRSDFASMQDRMIQVGFALAVAFLAEVAALIAAMVS